VLVLTISLDADDYCRALELGADAMLSKAAALDDITDARRQLRLSSDPESVVSEKRG
jgi:DNA-binding NarL/FixJ family response regulator